MARFYRLALQGALPLSRDGETDKPVALERDTLPETVDLVREWGRIGSPGTVRIDGFSNEAEARSAGARLAHLKHRKGYR
jgi:predicted DNA-binding WGR domain protein